MFDLAERPLVWIPVKWGMLKPSEETDKTAVEHEVSIEIEVEVKDRDELIALTGEMFGLSGSDKPDDSKKTQAEIIAEARNKEIEQFLALVNNWRKFNDGGKPVKFDAENVKRLLAVPGFLTGFQTAYLNACAGKSETREGN